METPNEEKRWDAPLFTLAPDAALPLDSIVATLTAGKVASINQAVVPARLEDANYLFELDRLTQEIVRAVVDKQAEGSAMVGDSLRVPHTERSVHLCRRVHLAELRRIQTQYLRMAKQRTPESIAHIASAFVDHINECLKQQA